MAIVWLWAHRKPFPFERAFRRKRNINVQRVSNKCTLLHSTHTNSRCNKKQPLYRLKGHTTGSQVDTDDTDDRRERLGDLALPLATGTGGGLSQRRMWACQPHAPMSRRANVQEDAGQAQLVHARSTAHMDSTQRHGHTPRLPRPPRPRRESEAATCT